MAITRPVRGAVRLEMRFDEDGLQEDLKKFANDWRPNPQSYGGEHWSDIKLVAPALGADGVDPRLDSSPHFHEIIEAFPSKCILFFLARLDAGTHIRRHRDMDGGISMGVARFHVPVVTNCDVDFRVEGKRIPMRAGETWLLDTTYRHEVHNDSSIPRVHAIIDIELNEQVSSMLPPRDWRDRLHTVRFAMAYAGKATSMAMRPAALWLRVRNFLRLKTLGPSEYHRTRGRR